MGFLGDEKKSFFGKLQQKIQDVILMRPEIDEETFDELEEALIGLPDRAGRWRMPGNPGD